MRPHLDVQDRLNSKFHKCEMPPENTVWLPVMFTRINMTGTPGSAPTPSNEFTATLGTVGTEHAGQTYNSTLPLGSDRQRRLPANWEGHAGRSSSSKWPGPGPWLISGSTVSMDSTHGVSHLMASFEFASQQKACIPRNAKACATALLDNVAS